VGLMPPEEIKIATLYELDLTGTFFTTSCDPS
jgi:hypothetical protein